MLSRKFSALVTATTHSAVSTMIGNGGHGRNSCNRTPSSASARPAPAAAAACKMTL